MPESRLLCVGGLVAALMAGAPTTTESAVVAFSGGDFDGWQTWNWDAITHLGFWSMPDADVVAQARKNSVRIFQDADLPDKEDWTDEKKRKDFAKKKAEQVSSNNLDGVFFDYEGNGLTTKQKEAYGYLAANVTEALAPYNATIFICVGGRPSYEFRDYPYDQLADASEFLFIMGYDMHFWDDYTCVLKGTCSPAEAPIKDIQLGVNEYTAKVDPDKLVLGLPWYGQRYEDILGVPVNYGQIDYKDVLALMNEPGKVVEKKMDEDSLSWRIKCDGVCSLDTKKDHGNVVYFDDASTLASKYEIARKAKLHGVGMWKADDLPLPNATGDDPNKKEREAMWAAIAAWDNSSSTMGR